MVAPLDVYGRLDGYPGAPFPLEIVDAASESVRSDAGWHIAPVVSETVLCDGAFSTLLHLPTMRLVSVSQVRVLVDGLWLVLEGWRVAGSGMLHHPLGWAYGIGSIEVDMTHGYDDVPADLLPVIAARCQRARVDASVMQRSETVGSRTSSESYNANRLEVETGVAAGLEKYRLTARVA